MVFLERLSEMKTEQFNGFIVIAVTDSLWRVVLIQKDMKDIWKRIEFGEVRNRDCD